MSTSTGDAGFTTDGRGMMGKTNAQIDKQHESIRYALEWYTEAFRRKLEADAELDRAASALDQTLAKVVFGLMTQNACFKRFTPMVKP